jgi:hypothetical protein
MPKRLASCIAGRDQPIETAETTHRCRDHRGGPDWPAVDVTGRAQPLICASTFEDSRITKAIA